jgi:hypothetical protein
MVLAGYCTIYESRSKFLQVSAEEMEGVVKLVEIAPKLAELFSGVDFRRALGPPPLRGQRTHRIQHHDNQRSNHIFFSEPVEIMIMVCYSIGQPPESEYVFAHRSLSPP